MSNSHVIILMALVLLLSSTYPVMSQINFSPGWGTGKRSGLGYSSSSSSSSSNGRHLASAVDSCWSNIDWRAFSKLAQIMAAEAAKYNECMQANTMSVFKDD